MSDIPSCRFCFEPAYGTEEDLGELISPCDCNGSQQFVHSGCLSRWQMTLITSSSDECRHTHCSVCGTLFRGVRIPGRADVMETFCGDSVISQLNRGSFLVASREASSRSIPTGLPWMIQALRELKLSHWKHSVYFVYDFENCKDGKGDEKVRAVNLTRYQNGSVEQPIPDEVLLDMECDDIRVRHHNGGPVKWSSHRTCMCLIHNATPEFVLQTFSSIQQHQQLASSSTRSLERVSEELNGIEDTNGISSCTRTNSAIANLCTESLMAFALPHCERSQIDDQNSSLVVGQFCDVLALLRCEHMKEQMVRVGQGAVAWTLYSFSGYAEWTRGQLLREIARGSWGVMSAGQALPLCRQMLEEGFEMYDLNRELWERVIDSCQHSGPNPLREEYERVCAANSLLAIPRS